MNDVHLSSIQLPTPDMLNQLSFDWDMAGLPVNFQQLSLELAENYQIKLLPFVSQQSDTIQHGIAAASANAQAFSSNMQAGIEGKGSLCSTTMTHLVCRRELMGKSELSRLAKNADKSR